MKMSFAVVFVCIFLSGLAIFSARKNKIVVKDNISLCQYEAPIDASYIPEYKYRIVFDEYAKAYRVQFCLIKAKDFDFNLELKNKLENTWGNGPFMHRTLEGARIAAENCRRSDIKEYNRKHAKIKVIEECKIIEELK